MRASQARQVVAILLGIAAYAGYVLAANAAEPKRTARLAVRHPAAHVTAVTPAVTIAPASTIAITAAPSPAKVDAPPQPAPHNEGLLGPVRIGAVGGVGFPRPLSIEGVVKVEDQIALGLEYGVLPTLSVSGVDARLNAISASVRVFPLKSGFFLGLGAGHQHLGASTVVTLPQGLGALPEEVTADTWFLNPRIGFLSTWSWGLTLGIDAGVQIPLSASFTNTIPTQLAVSQTATDVAHIFGKNVLPTIDLLKIGFLL